MTKCRHCGAEIVFVKSPKGKYIPCNAVLVPYWENPNAKTIIVTQDGEVKHCDLDGEPSKITDVGYIPHWATCTDPDRFRKPRHGA